MVRITNRKTEANRAAIYARVSDKSQDGEDKRSRPVKWCKSASSY